MSDEQDLPPDDKSIRGFIEVALDDLLSQPWMGIPPTPESDPAWAGAETIEELVADYRQALRGMQLKWLYETLTGNDLQPPTPEQAAQCNGRIQVAEVIRLDLLRILDHAKR